MNEERKKLPWKPVVLALLLVAEIAALSLIAWSAKSGPMSGIAVRQDAASITVSDQINVVYLLRVDHVLAPTDGWLVVQADSADGVSGAVLGSLWVPRGESRNVTIGLDPISRPPARLWVTLVADMGTTHVLEYPADMQAESAPRTTGSGPATALDKPVIAGGRPVSARVSVAAMSFAVGANQASISDTTRTAEATTVVVPKVVTPAPSWLSVSAQSTAGVLGEVLGEKLLPAGESTRVVVALGAPQGPRQLVATLHVDLGTVGRFDFSPLDLSNSYDLPYVAGGQIVSMPIRLVTPLKAK